MATDEGILGRSLGTALTRNSQGDVQQPDLLYRPYLVRAGTSQIACAFRDHTLSDLIGFTYATWPAEEAAHDFVGRIAGAGRRYAARTGGEDALVTIILDGENAWEHFEGGGRPFLRALYGQLAQHAEIETVTMARACEAPARELDGIAPGSWIDSDLYVWIGHRDDRRAWDQLAGAKDVLEAAREASPEARAQAAEEILIAEGSDWFWWYGDDRSSDHDREFDDLFRRHLRNVYTRLGRPIPDDLFLTNISSGPLVARAPLEPLALMTPVVDGEDTSYFEWLGAGRFDVVDITGAMHQTTRRRPAIRAVLFGFDRETLHVRVDGLEAVRDELERGRVIILEFLAPPGLRVALRRAGERTLGEVLTRGTDGVWAASGQLVQAAAQRVAELSLPFGLFGQTPEHVDFFVILREADGTEIERHPGAQPLRVALPDARFESQHWRV
jgi:hypothetical protein